MIEIRLLDGNVVWFNTDAIIAVGPRITEGTTMIGQTTLHTAMGVFIVDDSPANVARDISEAKHVA